MSQTTKIEYPQTKLIRKKDGALAAAAAVGTIAFVAQPAMANDDLSAAVTTAGTIATTAVGVGVAVVGWKIASAVANKIMNRT